MQSTVVCHESHSASDRETWIHPRTVWRLPAEENALDRYTRCLYKARQYRVGGYIYDEQKSHWLR